MVKYVKLEKAKLPGALEEVEQIDDLEGKIELAEDLIDVITSNIPDPAPDLDSSFLTDLLSGLFDDSGANI